MEELRSAYPIPAPHQAAPVGAAPIPEEAWKTYRVVRVDAAVVLTKGSLLPRSFALMEPEWAERKVQAGEARYETDREKQLALDNGHKRAEWRPPKKKAAAKKAPDSEKAADDGDSG